MYKIHEYNNDEKRLYLIDTINNVKVTRNCSSYDHAKEITLELNKSVYKSKLASIRYQKETSGILIDDEEYPSDRNSQAQINNIYQTLTNGFVDSIDFKSKYKWIEEMKKEDIEKIATELVNHVQTCFKTEKEISKQIDHFTFDDSIMDIDLKKLFDKRYDKNKK